MDFLFYKNKLINKIRYKKPLIYKYYNKKIIQAYKTYLIFIANNKILRIFVFIYKKILFIYIYYIFDYFQIYYNYLIF